MGGGLVNSWLAKLLGYGPNESVRDVAISWAAPWAQRAPLLVVGLCAVAALLAIRFYLGSRSIKHPRLRVVFASMRALLLVLLVLFLAEPTLEMRVATHPKPWLWLLFDGSASMGIEDEQPANDVESSTSLSPSATLTAPVRKPRINQVRDLLRKPDANVVERLGEKFRLRAFLFDRPGEVRPLTVAEADGENPDPKRLADELSIDGQVTALGDAFNDLRERYAAQRPAGVVVFSDFNKNAGLPPVETASRLDVPVYTVGLGPTTALDVAVDLTAPLLMKKGEQSELRVTLRSETPVGHNVAVRLTAHPVGTVEQARTVGERTVTLDVPTLEIPFSFSPDETGRFEFVAEATPLPGETIVDNNRAEREVNIRDDFLHLMYVDYEPDWEWRFIKEVFHRDRLVGMRGFRTFLRSADPKVRQTNELFLSSLTPPRAEFFVNDVLFLGDMPGQSLSTRFCEMVKEFVDKFGGGLVILAGPNFGPGQLAQTPLADLLPVRALPGEKFVDAGAKPFVPRLTEAAGDYDFMQLSPDPLENRNLWARLGPLEWHQPTTGVHDQARVLLEHPTAKCADGRTPQPILAVRRYGKGEVVFLAMNETWRLRREYGETYYRKFWGQMIHRLGLSHALGNQKRFVVRTDRRQYQAGDRVTLTVEAYDQNYEPLTTAKLPQPQLLGELIVPEGATSGPQASGGRRPLRLGQFREGVFETEFAVDGAGEYVARVFDPLAEEQIDVSFRVANLSAERRSAVRDAALERELANLESKRYGVTGRDYEPTTLDRIVDDIFVPDEVESFPERIALWNTWLAFVIVVLLMLVEWLLRKWVHLP
jgi:hypothetical protein